MTDRKEKRDAKNARHRRNEQRRFDRKLDKMFDPWRDMLDESLRYAVQQRALKAVAESGIYG